MDQALTDKVTRWYQLKAQVAQLTAEEATLRMEIASTFKDPPEKGSVRNHLGHGKDLKMTTKVNYSVDREKLALAHNQLPETIRTTVFKYKPEVVESELAKVTDPEIKAVLAQIITSKPGLPQVEIVDQKKRG